MINTRALQNVFAEGIKRYIYFGAEILKSVPIRDLQKFMENVCYEKTVHGFQNFFFFFFGIKMNGSFNSTFRRSLEVPRSGLLRHSREEIVPDIC